MRPALTLTLLLAASLALMSTDSKAQAARQAEQERLAKVAQDERKAELESRKAENDRLAKKAEMDKARQEKIEKIEAQRIARQEREKVEEQQRMERERKCVIKPVMTDAEIAQCKDAWR